MKPYMPYAHDMLVELGWALVHLNSNTDDSGSTRYYQQKGTEDQGNPPILMLLTDHDERCISLVPGEPMGRNYLLARQIKADRREPVGQRKYTLIYEATPEQLQGSSRRVYAIYKRGDKGYRLTALLGQGEWATPCNADLPEQGD